MQGYGTTCHRFEVRVSLISNTSSYSVVRSPTVHHTPLDCVGCALVLQSTNIGGEPRAGTVPLVSEVTEVSGGVPLSEVLGGADIQRHLVVAVLVLRGHLGRVHAVGGGAGVLGHGAVQGAACARKVRLRRSARQAACCCASL